MNMKPFEAPVPGRSSDRDPSEDQEMVSRARDIAQDLRSGKRTWCIVNTPAGRKMIPMETNDMMKVRLYNVPGHEVTPLTSHEAKKAYLAQKQLNNPADRDIIQIYPVIFKELEKFGEQR